MKPNSPGVEVNLAPGRIFDLYSDFEISCIDREEGSPQW